YIDMDRKRNVLAKLFVSCCLHNWIRDDFIARNPKGPVTHQQHELPTQNMMPLTCVGGYAKAEGIHTVVSPAARCVIDCSRGSAPSRAARTTQRGQGLSTQRVARKTHPLVNREPVVSSVTEHGARSAESPVAELGKRSLSKIKRFHV
ncbi:hypothetical protein J6590_103764, partial [Homalodisca vitripennis]